MWRYGFALFAAVLLLDSSFETNVVKASSGVGPCMYLPGGCSPMGLNGYWQSPAYRNQAISMWNANHSSRLGQWQYPGYSSNSAFVHNGFFPPATYGYGYVPAVSSSNGRRMIGGF